MVNIQDFFAEHKTLPSFNHVVQLLGFKSKNAVTSFAAQLKLQGFSKQLKAWEVVA